MLKDRFTGSATRRLLLALVATTGLLGACSGGGESAAVDPPTITSQPLATTVDDGQGVSFTVAASGESLGYQWQKNDADLPGATAATLTLPSVTLADTGARYRVVVGNAGGSVTSEAATLTVRPVAPRIATQPVAARVAQGAAATFSVAAAGSLPLTYQWQRNGIDIAGATQSSYTIDAAMQGDNGATFAVRVRNGAGSATSDAVALIVDPAPLAITAAPQAASAVEGATARFSVTATGSGTLTYRWRRNGTDITGATAATYTTPVLALADDGARYSVRVSDGTGSVTSAEAVLTVTPRPSGFGSVTVSGPGVPAGYTWSPTQSVPKSGVPPVIWAAQSGFQQLNITVWSAGGVFTGVSIVASPGTLGGTSAVNLNCNVGGTPSGCDFAALRIGVDTDARTLTFDDSPIRTSTGATLTVNGSLRW